MIRKIEKKTDFAARDFKNESRFYVWLISKRGRLGKGNVSIDLNLKPVLAWYVLI